MSVARAQREINSKEFAEWIAYERIEPGDPIRSDWRSAMIAWVISQTMATKKTKMEIKDFMPKFGENLPEDKKDWRSIKQKMLSWAEINNQRNRVKEKKKKEKQ